MAGTTDTVKAMLTPGEFVIRKEAVDMIGVPILEKLNDMPEAGGHSEIDRLIGMATLKNMTGMYGGGNVEAYGHGGKVHSGLKPIPNNNPGLAKLPEKVRNKMGYMQEGGLMGMMHGGKAKKKKKMYGYQEGGSIEQAVNKLVPYIAYSDGGEKGRNVTLKAYANPSDSTVFYQHYYQPFLYDRSGKLSGFVDKKGDKHFHTNKKLLDMAKSMSDDDFDYTNIGSIANRYFDLEGKKYADFKFPGMQDGGSVDSSSSNYLNYILQTTPPDTMKSIMESGFRTAPKELFDKANAKTDSLMNAARERQKMLMEQSPELFQENQEPIKGGFFKKLLGMQEGGAVQEDAMMQQYLQSMEAQQPNSFVPFDQRPPSSGEVMSPIPRGMEQGDYYRSLRGELEMENEELVRDKAQNTLDRIRLDSLLNQVEESKMDSLLNQAPPINEMLRSLPDFPTIENPPRPTKTDFLKELLREGVII